jgi:hypothetical protein
MKLTPSDSNNPVVLPLGKLMPSVDYFGNSYICKYLICPQKKFATGTCAVGLFPVQSIYMDNQHDYTSAIYDLDKYKLEMKEADIMMHLSFHWGTA